MMNDVLSASAAAACVIALLMGVLWLASLRLRDASIVDRFWGPGFILVAVTAIAWMATAAPRPLLLLTLVTLWGTRLALYITWRNWETGEDRRYRAMRENHPHNFPAFSLWAIFGLQGALMWFISLPLQVAVVSAGPPLNWLDVMGVLVWAVGWLFETVGDWQLARFKANPANKGKTCTRGLWRYTRHPNYFGDALVWWGLFIIALSAPIVAWTFLSPLLMTFLLLKVSGVRLLESHLAREKAGYSEYVQQTNAFLPWFPRKG